MKLTKERVIPKLMDPMNGLLLEHLARYYFAAPYCRGRVLDIACGVGYGSFMVARYCKKTVSEVVGADCDKASIDYAHKYYNHPKCTYVMADAQSSSLPKELGNFDTIISFETIEHLTDEVGFINNLWEMLLPGGTLVISTPFGKGRAHPSNEPYHSFQLTHGEFANLLSSFSEVDMFYQKGVVIYPEYAENLQIGIAVARK